MRITAGSHQMMDAAAADSMTHHLSIIITDVTATNTLLLDSCERRPTRSVKTKGDICTFLNLTTKIFIRSLEQNFWFNLCSNFYRGSKIKHLR